MMRPVPVLSLFPLLLSVLAAQDFQETIKIERIFGGYRYTEGPAWSPEKFLVFFDVPTARMLKWVPGGKPEPVRDNTGGAIGAMFDAQNRLFVCESRNRRVVRFDKKGEEVLAERWQGKRLNAPNDLALRRDGHLYFTDPAFGSQSDSRELDFYGIFHITPKGELERVAAWKTRPNGIALNAAGRLLYVADSDERSVHVFDVDAKGSATNDRVFIPNIEGIPDGLRVDDKGNIFVAAAKVEIYSPQGKQIYAAKIGEKPSNFAFGDPDLGTLYITARTSVYRTRTGTKGVLPYP